MATELTLDSHLKVSFIVQSAHEKLMSFTHRYTISGGSITVGNVNEVALQLYDGWTAVICSVLSTRDKFAAVNVKWFGGSTQLDGVSDHAPTVGLVEDSDTLPEEDCVVIRKRTGLQGRTHRGRVFVPLVPEVFQNDGRLTDDAIGFYEALANKFKDVWTFSGTIAGLTGTPKHAAFHAGTLDTIQEVGVVVDVLNRRDRRDPRQLIYQRA